MSREPSNLIPMPASRDAVSLLSVDRALSELRRGRVVAIRGGDGSSIIAMAAEAVTPEGLQFFDNLSEQSPSLAITARRASVLGLANPREKVAVLEFDTPLTTELVTNFANPLAVCELTDLQVSVKESHPFDGQSAAVALTKLARLLPAAIMTVLADSEVDDFSAWANRHDILLLDAGDIFQYDVTSARSLKKVSETQVALIDAANTRIIAFRPSDGGLEHLAIVIGEPDPAEPVLTRLHSECFTGDLLGSLRCDCGDQLRGAISEIAARGSGVLLYLAQEGRGIGLVNKLRAYALQDLGFDTLDANEQLGFDADERIYLPAARMLRQLGYTRIQLLTNNPDKHQSLARCGVDVVKRVAHSFPSNEHNELYLKTKATRSGHLL